jgi:membrane-associated phospholipid phosphatase
MTTESSAARGADQLGTTIARFDAHADQLLDRLRGIPAVDSVMVRASKAGDWSLVWHAINLVRAARLRRPDDLVRFAVLIGLESLIVNQGVKRLFRRERPTDDGDPTLTVRRPSTSSFPSGHASAATVAALALSRRAPSLAPLWWLLAATVGLSRAHVRIHHMSDVVGGVITGVGIWRTIGRRLIR